MPSVRRLPPGDVIAIVPLADCLRIGPGKPWPTDLSRWAASRPLPYILRDAGLRPALCDAVESTWSRVLKRVESGLRIERDGEDRVVVHCDTVRYHISHAGFIDATYPIPGGTYVPGLVEIGRPLPHWTWVRTIANLEIDLSDDEDWLARAIHTRRLAGLLDREPGVVESAAQKWVVEAVVALARRRFNLFEMRQRLRAALAPDPQFLETARRAWPRTRPDVDLASCTWTLCLAHREQLTELYRLAPGLLPYFGVLINTGKINPIQPVMLILRKALGGKALPPGDWKLLLGDSLRPIWQMFRSGEIAGHPSIRGFLRDWAILHRGLPRKTRLPLALWAPLTRTWIEPCGKRVKPSIGWHLAPKVTGQAIYRYWQLEHQGLGQRFVDEEWGPVVRWAANYSHQLTLAYVRTWSAALREARKDERRLRAAAKAQSWHASLPKYTDGVFVGIALTSSLDLSEEAIAMRHCADRYAEECAQGRAVVYSLRDANTHRRLASFCALVKPLGAELADIKRSLNRTPSEEEFLFAHQTIDALNMQLRLVQIEAFPKDRTSQSWHDN